MTASPASCAVCHDPHGSSEQRALVRFDRSQVTSNSLGVLLFQSAGSGSGSCDLECHGYDHVDARY